MPADWFTGELAEGCKNMARIRHFGGKNMAVCHILF